MSTPRLTWAGGAWLGGLAASGAPPAGRPLDVGGKDVRRDAITDVPAEHVGIGGYLVINAESLEEAARIAQGSPHIALRGRTSGHRRMNVS